MDKNRKRVVRGAEIGVSAVKAVYASVVVSVWASAAAATAVAVSCVLRR